MADTVVSWTERTNARFLSLISNSQIHVDNICNGEPDLFPARGSWGYPDCFITRAHCLLSHELLVG
eukprot:9715471-Lingulodinium_polyedra.AAC.1